MLSLLILILSITSLIYININYRNYNYTSEEDTEIIEILSRVDEKYLCVECNNRVDAFSAIYYNLTTPSGGSALTSKPEYQKKLNEVERDFEEEDCNKIKRGLRKLQVK